MEGASTSRGPSKPDRNVIVNAQNLFRVLHDETISSHDKLKQITELLNGVDVDVNFPDEYDGRNTLLHGAVSHGFLEVVKHLLENGADVNIANTLGETPLHIAVARGFVNIVQLIIYEKKDDVSKEKVNVNVQQVDVNIQSSNGETIPQFVLSDAKVNRNKCGKPVVQMPLGSKADVNITNSVGKTPLDLAKEMKNLAIIALLECKKTKSSLIEVHLRQDNNMRCAETSIAEATSRENQIQQVPDSVADLPKTYDSCGAKDSMHGTLYQLHLLMLFAIRALVKRYKFILGTEVKEAEQFDDLVLKYQFPNTDSFKNLLLQAKSKENADKGISFTDLIDEKNAAQFSLLKYYKSFIKIRGSKGLEANNFDFAICTNTHFNFSESGVLIGDGKKLVFELVTGICEGFFKEGQCYKLVTDEDTLDWLKINFAQKLNKEKDKLKPTDNKCKELVYILSCLNDTHSVMRDTFRVFLNKLVFVVGHSADIEFVKTEFREYSKIKHLDTKLHTDAFFKQIFDWFSQKEGVWLTNGMVEEMIGKIWHNAFATSVSQVYVETSRNSNIKFNIGKLDELNERISENKIVNLITPVETKLTLLQVAQALECSPAYKAHGFIFIDFSSLLLSETQERTIRAFESPRNNHLLVIDCVSEKKDTSSGNLTTLQEALWNITATNIAKKIILISPENHALSKMFQTWPGYYSQHIKHVFNDFNKETQDVFLTTKVKFQGKHIELNKVIGEADTELLQIVPLETLIGGDELVIGKDLPTSTGYNKSYYIDRSLTYQTVIKAMIFQDKLCGIFKDEIAATEIEFENLCSTHPEANIHLIEKQGDILIWVKSKGDLTALRRYIDNENTQACSEDLFLASVKQQRVVIISNLAGMGKSTILDHISKKIKRKDKGTLVLRIELNIHTKALQQKRKKDKREKSKIIFNNISAMDFLFDLLMMKTKLEKELLKRNRKTVLMFDGFDEISPDFNEMVLDFILHLIKATDGQIWITTRPFMSTKLENELHQFFYTLKAFSKSDQIEFLTKYWKHKKSVQNLQADQITIFAESIINKISESINDKEREFTGIPLQMRMVAETFDDDLTNSSEVEKCFNLVYLYDKFIKKKRKVFYFDKNCFDDSKVGVTQVQKEHFKIYKARLRRIALTVIFPDNIVSLLQPSSKEENYSDKSFVNLNRMGIVNVIDGRPYFIHRTFAEYFVAVHFIKLLIKKEHLNNDGQDFICSELLISKNYTVIRAFFNGLLAKYQHIHNIIPTRPFKNLIGTFRDAVFSEKPKQIKLCILLTAKEGHDQIFLNLSHYVQAQPITLRKLLTCTSEDYEAMLYKAAKKNNHAYIKTLLQWTRDNMEQGQEIVKLMLVAVDEKGDTSLIKASQMGYKYAVQTLLQWTRDNMDGEKVRLMLLAANNDGVTALMMASYQGRNEVVQTLLQWTRDKMDQEIVRLMLLAGNNEGVTALMIASYQGRNDVVQTLLQWTRDKIDQGQEIVRLMLLATKNDGFTALMMATYQERNDVVQTLLQWTRDQMDHGQEIVRLMLLAANKERMTALIWASYMGHNSLVQTLLQWTRDKMDQGQEILRLMILPSSKNDTTVLIYGSMQGHNDVVQTLLMWARDHMDEGKEMVKQMLLATNGEGITALGMASIRGHNDVVQTLLMWTRDSIDEGKEMVKQMLLATNGEGNTALIILSRLGHHDVIETLLQWTLGNTDEETLHELLTARDNNGNTALDLAEESHLAEIVEILKKYARPV